MPLEYSLSSSFNMVGRFGLFTFLGLLSLEMAAKSEERNYWIVIEKISFKRVAQEYLNKVKCEVTQLQNRSYVDCNLILQRDIENINMELHVDIKKMNKQNMRLFSAQLELCDLSTLVHKNPFINILMKSFINVINTNVKCPLRAHFNYTVHNWHMVETDFPSYTPECQLRGNTKFFTNNKMALIMNFWGSIVHNK
ncbi:hypothetical protein KR044_002959 [Drosophila immigrans]|nr:hypothetical protein KR044_002959 [Drosophila immigrans]